MSFNDTVAYLYKALPMFQRDGSSAYKKDLNNTIELSRLLDYPETKFKSIHVAGTNGKGSSSHMLAAILQASGLKVGLYTSPHLKSFTERIRVNGEAISEQGVIDFVALHKAHIETLKPSFFEITVAMAFDWFAKQEVDIAVIEVGLGGRLDSTNIITPELSLITNISLDHQYLLGDTLEAIASEKAGIIKNDTPVVISERQSSVEQVFIEKSQQEASPIYFATDNFQLEQASLEIYNVIDSRDNSVYVEGVEIDLKGDYQKNNVLGVIQVVDILREQGYVLTDEHVRIGLAETSLRTGIKGRWQTLQVNPRVICDTGHNAAGIDAILKQLDELEYSSLCIILGMVNDKDIKSLLVKMPKTARYIFTQANIPRALPKEKLQAIAQEVGLEGTLADDVNLALDEALGDAAKGDVIFVGGSTFVVAELNGL